MQHPNHSSSPPSQSPKGPPPTPTPTTPERPHAVQHMHHQRQRLRVPRVLAPVRQRVGVPDGVQQHRLHLAPVVRQWIDTLLLLAPAAFLLPLLWPQLLLPRLLLLCLLLLLPRLLLLYLLLLLQCLLCGILCSRGGSTAAAALARRRSPRQRGGRHRRRRPRRRRGEVEQLAKVVEAELVEDVPHRQAVLLQRRRQASLPRGGLIGLESQGVVAPRCLHLRQCGALGQHQCAAHALAQLAQVLALLVEGALLAVEVGGQHAQELHGGGLGVGGWVGLPRGYRARQGTRCPGRRQGGAAPTQRTRGQQLPARPPASQPASAVG